MFNDYLVFVWSLFLFYQFEECFFSKLKIKDTYRFFFNLLSVCTIFFLIQNTFILLLNFTIWHKYLKVQHFPFDFVIQGLFYLYLSSRTLSHAVSFLDDKALMVDCFHATDLILFFQYEATEGENTIDLFWAVRKEKGNIRSHGSSQCFRYQIHVLVLLSFWQLQIHVKFFFFFFFWGGGGFQVCESRASWILHFWISTGYHYLFEEFVSLVK